MSEPVRGLDALMTPRSVAIIGASDDATRIGGRPLRYLLDAGYRGQVYPVNPRRPTVQELPAFASLDEIGAPVDLAIVAVPAAAVITTLEQCAASGVGAAVVFSSGFAEMGDEGSAVQDRMRAIAHASGMRILGPNCLGHYNAGIGLFATFSSSIELGRPVAGPVGVVSQSGAYGGHVAFLARSRGVHVGLLITTGNECDVEAAECIEWMAGRDEVRVIAACAEGLRDGDALCRALEAARAHRKPLVFLKMGRSAAGARAAMSHTASLAGRDAVYDAVFREFGVHRARDTDEMIDVAYTASFGILPAEERLGLVSVSGGMGIQMADAAERAGVTLVPMPEQTQARLKRRLPFASPVNPVDITAQVFNDHALLEENLDAMLEEGGYTALVAFFTYVAGVEFMAAPLRAAMARARERFPDRLIALSIIAPAHVVRAYESVGCPCFEDPDRAVRAVVAVSRFAQAFDAQPRGVPEPVEVSGAPPDLSRALDEQAALAMLVGAGLQAPPVRVAGDAHEAARAADALGFPVAMKIRSVDIAHKSDVGGVCLGLDSEQAVREAFTRMLAQVGERAPGARLDGVLITPMAPPGIDMILGVQRDALFGPVLMVGLGGVFVEVLEDVVLERAPVDDSSARAMLRRLKAWPLLDGARGGDAADVDALCAAMVALSRFAAAHRDAIESIDVNPLRVFARGRGAWMLDALIQARQR